MHPLWKPPVCRLQRRKHARGLVCSVRCAELVNPWCVDTVLGEPGASVGSVLHQRRVSGRNVSSRHDRHAAGSQSSARRADRAPTTAQLYSSVPVRATMGDIRCVVCITLFICIDAYYTHISKSVRGTLMASITPSSQLPIVASSLDICWAPPQSQRSDSSIYDPGARVPRGTSPHPCTARTYCKYASHRPSSVRSPISSPSALAPPSVG